MSDPHDDLKLISKTTNDDPTVEAPEGTPLRDVGVAMLNLNTLRRTLFCFNCFAEWVEGEQQRHKKSCPRLTDR